MDFYIRTVNSELYDLAAGSPWGIRYATEYITVFLDQNVSPFSKVIKLGTRPGTPVAVGGGFTSNQFIVDQEPYYTVSDVGYMVTVPGSSVVPVYETIDSSDYIARVPNSIIANPSFSTGSPVIIRDNYLRSYWITQGWTPGTQATFEEELCDFFYTVSEEQPSNLIDWGVPTNTVNLYLFRIYLAYTDDYADVPIFTRGNDPARDRVYTGQLIP